MVGGLLITREYVASLTKRDDFYDKLPEFRSLRNVPAPKSGCKGCGSSKAISNQFNLFRQVLAGFEGPAADRFKKYVNAEFVQFIGYNPRTRRVETITL